MWNAKRRKQNGECETQNTEQKGECGTQKTEGRMENTERKTQEAERRMWNAKCTKYPTKQKP